MVMGCCCGGFCGLVGFLGGCYGGWSFLPWFLHYYDVEKSFCRVMRVKMRNEGVGDRPNVCECCGFCRENDQGE